MRWMSLVNASPTTRHHFRIGSYALTLKGSRRGPGYRGSLDSPGEGPSPIAGIGGVGQNSGLVRSVKAPAVRRFAVLKSDFGNTLGTV